MLEVLPLYKRRVDYFDFNKIVDKVKADLPKKYVREDELVGTALMLSEYRDQIDKEDTREIIEGIA